MVNCTSNLPLSQLQDDQSQRPVHDQDKCSSLPNILPAALLKTWHDPLFLKLLDLQLLPDLMNGMLHICLRH